uniref:Myotubularin related protein 14 n=1 Tax=Nothobranchius furzeri TaxID=105023 RepID=A0A8C6PBQ1_NOTFU
MAASPCASGLSVRKSEDITELIELFSKTQYRAKEVSPRMETIEKRCLELFARDYKFSIIHNSNGEVCGHYPRQIVFLEYECVDVDRDRFESTVQISKLQDLVSRSKLARCRGRFVCPVILYNGKHICRSSTLAGWGELYGRTGYNYIFSACSASLWVRNQVVPNNPVRPNNSQQLQILSDLKPPGEQSCLNVTSSEKVDKAQRYADFALLSVPYPGCEFFKEYKDRNYTAEGLVFNWNQDYVDAPLTIPASFTQKLNIDWTQYQSWDLVEQTQNYLKLLLHIINNDDDCGLLVHCISGWDRTPLFVSLLRLSLWADGAVHANLEPAEILYLTIAYDWFFFGHMLPDRLSKGEEIFFFCFNSLKHIVSEKFSVVRKQRRKYSHFRDGDLTVEDLCQLQSRDRGSVSSLSSDFSLITEEADCAADPVDMFFNQRKIPASTPSTAVWCKQGALDEQLSHPVSDAKSSGSSSSSRSEHGAERTSSSPLAVPSRISVPLCFSGCVCPLPLPSHLPLLLLTSIS